MMEPGTTWDVVVPLLAVFASAVIWLIWYGDSKRRPK